MTAAVGCAARMRLRARGTLPVGLPQKQPDIAKKYSDELPLASLMTTV